MTHHSIILSHAQNLELYGLEVNFLAPASLEVYHAIMARPGAGIVPSNIREDAEVVL